MEERYGRENQRAGTTSQHSWSEASSDLERQVSRYPAGPRAQGSPTSPRAALPAALPASGRLRGRPTRTLGGCSRDARPKSRPCPTRACYSPAPAATLALGVGRVFWPDSCHSPARPGQRAPKAPHGSGAPRASRFRPAPWQAAQAAEPRSSGPAPAARSSSWRCPLGTDQQQDGGQPRGRGAGRHSNQGQQRTRPCLSLSPINSLSSRSLQEFFPPIRQLSRLSECASRAECLGHVTVTA